MKIYPVVITSPILQKQELKLTAKLEIARFIFHPICTLIKLHPSFSFIFTFRCFRSERYRWDQIYPKDLFIISPMLHRYNVKLCKIHIELLARAKLIALGHLLTKRKSFRKQLELEFQIYMSTVGIHWAGRRFKPGPGEKVLTSVCHIEGASLCISVSIRVFESGSSRNAF